MSVDSSRFAKTAKKTVRRGVSLYKVGASPYWYARIWNSSVGKYIVRSTKETSRLVAAEVAEELYSDLKQKKFLDEVPRTKTFIYFAEKLIKQQRRLAGKTRSSAFASDDEKLLKRNGDGIIDYFYKRDITLIRTSDITEYFNVLDDNRTKPLSASSKNKHNIIIKKVLRLAYDDGVLQTIPPSPKIERKDNPRVSFSEEQYSYFLKGISSAIKRKDIVRGNVISDEFYYFVLLLVHSYLRPTRTEAFGLKHQDIEIKDNPPHIQLDVDGKTGRRLSASTEYGVEFYQKLKACNPDYNSLEDYIFLPKMKNRETATRIGQRFFNHVVEKENLKFDKDGNPRSFYSLRHYALQTRLRKSGGAINIYEFAKNAGTSVNQLERFYLKFMERSPAQIKNLQTFASE
ncbi:integrase [Rhodobacteraceae bacterium]|nr:integrase [Paracoccaceae bacterium]